MSSDVGQVPVAGRHAEDRGLRRTLATSVVAAVAAILLATLVSAAGTHRLGFDFRAAYLPAAEAVRDGRSPYEAHAVADRDWHPYLYPPQLAIALVPATALRFDVAALPAFLVSLAAVLAALAVVGVTDVRRHAVKLFLWPAPAWTLSTRRFGATLIALGVGASVTLAAWAVIGFAGLREYPELRNELGNEASYSIVAVSGKLGYGAGQGDVVAALAGGLLLGVALWFGRHRDDLRAFTAALGSALALSPSLWQHYRVRLLVPIALTRPRFSFLRLAPIVVWVCPRAGNGEGVQTVLPLLPTAFVLAVILVRPAQGRLAEARS